MTKKKFAWGLAILLLLGIFDGISTYVLCAKHQFGELNPIMRWALGLKNPMVFFILKFSLTISGAWFLWETQSIKLAQIAKTSSFVSKFSTGIIVFNSDKAFSFSLKPTIFSTSLFNTPKTNTCKEALVKISSRCE